MTHLYVDGTGVAHRFWAKVDRTDGCWNWTGVTNGCGYGQLYGGVGGRRGKMVYAHRLSWELAFGPVPEGGIVMHRCDNRACVRPDHLRIGTYADNSQDMASKGRAKPSNVRGADLPQAKLTDDQVREIRRRAAAGDGPVLLAREFGVDRGQVWRIVKRRSWRHLS